MFESILWWRNVTFSVLRYSSLIKAWLCLFKAWYYIAQGLVNIFTKTNALKKWQTDFFPLSASDLVMKVDALLTAAPKGEVRRDVHFIKDTHRWDFFFPFGICSLIGRYSCSFFCNGPENCNAIISRSAELQVFWFAVLLIKDCMTLFVEFALVCFFCSSACFISLHVRTRCSIMLWQSLTPSQERHRRFPPFWL